MGASTLLGNNAVILVLNQIGYLQRDQPVCSVDKHIAIGAGLLGLISGQVKSDTESLTARHSCDVSFGSVLPRR